MKESTAKFLAKAEQAIGAAETLLDGGHADFAVGRAYYAMFYVAEALLNEKDLRFRKHAGVHSAFGQHFAKTGELDAKYHRWLLAAFERRAQADYGVEAVIMAEDARLLIDQAVEFLREARRYLEEA